MIKRFGTAGTGLIVLLGGIFLFSCWQIAVKLLDYERNDRLYEELRSRYADEFPPPSPAVEETKIVIYAGTPVYRIISDAVEKHRAEAAAAEEKRKMLETNIFSHSPDLLEQNRDLVGWIRVPDTRIDYPVVQAKNSDYYLDRDFHKKKSSAGSIFMDFRNDGGFSDSNSILYGHNMKNGSMFHDLLRFREKEFFEQNRLIYLYTPEGVQKYEVVLAFVTDVSFDYLKTDFASEREWKSFMNAVRKKAYQAIPAPGLDWKDRLLTLSTCSYETDDSRTVVMARPIN